MNTFRCRIRQAVDLEEVFWPILVHVRAIKTLSFVSKQNKTVQLCLELQTKNYVFLSFFLFATSSFSLKYKSSSFMATKWVRLLYQITCRLKQNYTFAYFEKLTVASFFPSSIFNVKSWEMLYRKIDLHLHAIWLRLLFKIVQLLFKLLRKVNC